MIFVETQSLMTTILAALQLVVALLVDVNGNTNATPDQKQQALTYSLSILRIASGDCGAGLGSGESAIQLRHGATARSGI
jgi:hypothetical protein